MFLEKPGMAGRVLAAPQDAPLGRVNAHHYLSSLLTQRKAL